MNGEPDERRGPGRPRKWAKNAERMRAYRGDKRAELDTLRDIDSRGDLLDRLQRVTAERDALQVEANELRARVRQLEQQPAAPVAGAGAAAIATGNAGASVTGPAASGVHSPPQHPSGLSRAQRRQMERQNKKRRNR